MTDHTHDSIKHFVDGMSLMTVLGTLTEMLPSISALLSIVWVSIRIWETDTVQGLFKRKGEDNASGE
jgi:hypothetical protein